MAISPERRLTNNVSKRIKELCKQRKWTLHKLAVEAGIPAATLHYLMNKTRDTVNLATIQKICIACGISVFDFFDRTYFKEIPPEE